MTKEKCVDYLVLGGERHGEVWSGLYIGQMLQLAKKHQPLAKFYSRDQEAEITVPLNDVYFVTEYDYQGAKYLVASTEPISGFNVDNEIQKLLPNGLTAIS
ncbi:hypothetical protein HFD91_07730 [Enterobacteriaceae bacterium EKM102V]|uniref:hypothetical protein n=1 Tax=Pantoea TaxID=53335 RepID=UPI00142E20D1|nr:MULTISPECIES: hypothetical protein [Pantoea]KAF6661271.1 hypothetical protein HFD91_07730 [Enterobacteriaceae bacterium EKM102V]KAF6668220.1 hypothetical protein HFD97_09325 [Pantoea sp. EKM103V]